MIAGRFDRCPIGGKRFEHGIRAIAHFTGNALNFLACFLTNLPIVPECQGYGRVVVTRFFSYVAEGNSSVTKMFEIIVAGLLRRQALKVVPLKDISHSS